MAFLKHAKAKVQKSDIKLAEWSTLTSKALTPAPDFQKRTAQVVLDEYDPSRYMLSHATIVASVDVEDGPGELGRHFEDGFEVNRQYPDYYITAETEPLINNNCFVPGTLITMSDGTLKPIEQVQVGEMVITHLGRSRKVLRTMSRNVEEKIQKIKPRGTTERLLVTGEHPIFVFRSVKECIQCSAPIRRSVHAISFLLGKHYCSKECYFKKRVTNRKLLENKTGEFVEAKLLQRTDFTCTPILEDTIETGLTLGQARLIGLFAAEGYYTLYAYRGNERTSPIWAFNKSETHTLAKTVQDLLLSEFGVSSKIHQHNFDGGIHVTTSVNPELVRFFEHWVIGEHSNTKTLHSDLLRASPEIQMEVLKGWFEGDGSFTNNDCDFRLTGASSSRSLANQMQMLLHRVGISSHLTIAKTVGRKRVVDPDGSVRIINDPTKICTSWMVCSGGGWLEPLVEGTCYEAVYNATLEARGGVQNVPELRFLNGYHLQMMEKIEQVDYSGPVYNIEVEEDNSYLAQAIAVHNCDSFERNLLLATYKTFIGAQSYVEHVQVPELSKGRIIDAAARDVGNSIYIDILIANELKHKPLIQAIKSGQLGTLSMGCSTTFSVCTKCGNVAKDETELCFHIKHFKGETFIDELGNKRKIAELVGHASDPESCKFVEASWVANPAFKGAVIRNILNATEANSLAKKVHVAFNAPIPQHAKGAIAKAAKTIFAQGEEEPVAPEATEEQATAVPDGSQEVPAEQPAAPAPPVEEDPIDKAVKDLTEAIRTKAIEQVRSEVEKTETKEDNNPNLQNESLIKSAMQNPAWRKVATNVIKTVGKSQAKRIMTGLLLHKEGGWSKVARAGFTGKEILAVSRIVDTMTRKTAMAGETNVYRAVIDVGGIGPYENEETYLAACRQVLGRVLTGSEASMLLTKGRLFALGKKRQ